MCNCAAVAEAMGQVLSDGDFLDESGLFNKGKSESFVIVTHFLDCR